LNLTDRGLLDELLDFLARVVCYHPSVELLYIFPARANNEDDYDSRAFSTRTSTSALERALRLARCGQSSVVLRGTIEYIGGDFIKATRMEPTVAAVSDPWLRRYIAQRIQAYHIAIQEHLVEWIPVADVANMVSQFLEITK